jgi:hypothetical protein
MVLAAGVCSDGDLNVGPVGLEKWPIPTPSEPEEEEFRDFPRLSIRPEE